MKLSANARKWVAKSVRDAFAEDLKKAEKALEDYRESKDALYRKFEAEVEKLAAGFLKEATALAKRMKLTFREGKSLDHIQVYDKDGRYDQMDEATFVETYKPGDEENALEAAVREVEENIRTAVSKALFEVEVHGKKDTLATIVADVIKSIKEEK